MRGLMILAFLVAPLAGYAADQHEHEHEHAVKAEKVTLSGVVSGAVCGVHGMVCTHKPDPEHHYELLGLFVDGKGFFFLINVPPEVLRKVNREEVTVEGELYPDMHAVYVHTLRKGDQVIFQQAPHKHEHD